MSFFPSLFRGSELALELCSVDDVVELVALVAETLGSPEVASVAVAFLLAVRLGTTLIIPEHTTKTFSRTVEQASVLLSRRMDRWLYSGLSRFPFYFLLCFDRRFSWPAHHTCGLTFLHCIYLRISLKKCRTVEHERRRIDSSN